MLATLAVDKAAPMFETAAPIAARARVIDAPQVFETLTIAFAADPAARWMFPDQRQYLRHFPAFANILGGAALARGSALLGHGHAGAALWLAPGTGPDHAAMTALLETSVAAAEKSDALAVFAATRRHRPEEPHWYLAMIGVEPAWQGLGYGSAMLKRGLKACDAVGFPAYLVATTPRGAALCARHGFEVIREIAIGRCPPIFPMLRAARC